MAGGARRVRVAIALGSNLGDRNAHLTWALGRLTEHLQDLRVSPHIETVPVDVPDRQPNYLNAVAVGHTRLPAQELLTWLLALEASRGRQRTGVRSARTLDLDLILYGDAILATPELMVPHPRYRERDFVLAPLAALAPRWRDPETGETLAALWRRRQASGRPPRSPARRVRQPVAAHERRRGGGAR